MKRPVQASLLDDGKERPVGRIPRSVMGGTNADLIAAVADLYLAGSVMDVTYGDGGWWQRFTPDPFIKHDLYKVDGVDFRALPEKDGSVDTVCFDPPYVISGSASSERLGPDFQDRYGVGTHNLGPLSRRGGTPAFEQMILDGMAEACRTARTWVLVKCMEFSQGSHVSPARRFHDVPFEVTAHARTLGWWKHDQIVHHTGSGPGGHNIFDAKRARRHHSYLIVFARVATFPTEAEAD